MNLPFLKEKTWPKLAKPMDESRYGFDEDDDIIEQALDGLIKAIEAKDRPAVMEALTALIHCIKNKEESHGDVHESA